MKVAVIGTGHWGVNLVRNFAQLGALACVHDADFSRAARIAAQYGVGCAASYGEILADSGIGAVVIATPAHTHHELARAALLAGKDAFVEKPITLRASECEDLIDLAARRSRILMVGHLLKYHPAVLKLKQLVSSGELGRIEYIYSNRLNMGKVRHEENALWSFAPHDISVILYLLGAEMPLLVTATGGNYLQPNIADVTVSNLLFNNGVRAHIFVSWLHPYKEQKLVVIGSKAMAAFDDVSAGPKLQVFTKNIELRNGNFVAQKPVARAVEYSGAEPLSEECAHFLECLETRAEPRSDGRDGLRVLNILHACQRSLQLNGEPVQLLPRAVEACA